MTEMCAKAKLYENIFEKFYFFSKKLLHFFEKYVIMSKLHNVNKNQIIDARDCKEVNYHGKVQCLWKRRCFRSERFSL